MRVTLKHGKEKSLHRGYPWFFSNQVSRVEGEPGRGDVVRVADGQGKPLGQAIYHEASLIAGRMLTEKEDVEIDAAFFERRVLAALALRQRALPEATHARLIFSESDGIPGTIVDRYGDVLTISTISYGMEQRRDWILDPLIKALNPVAIVERNDAALRAKDGLPERQGVISGTLPEVVHIEEPSLGDAPVRFEVDVLNGPKTGFFIDQRFNRIEAARHARGGRVLDVFSADGGFALHAAAAGATHVDAVDSSQSALDRVVSNAELNGMADRVATHQADALEWVGETAREVLAGRHEPYDLVILDPPGFAKSRKQLEGAVKAYQRINISGFQMLAPGGVLATASCSQALDQKSFLDIVRYSARKAGVRLQLLHRGSQPPDHPVLDAMPETEYLSFFIFRALPD
ncbi:class I SAM-dependent rRNA methyltransferase [soil metagenome]